jgi:hypothetical protein
MPPYGGFSAAVPAVGNPHYALKRRKGSETKMIKISKNQKEYLLSRGCKWHKEIMVPYTHRHYYAIESNKVKRLLNEYKENTLINTLEPSVP